MRILFVIVLLVCVRSTFAQQNAVLMNTFYKDQLFNTKNSRFFAGSGFLPVLESDVQSKRWMRDSSVQYYDGGERIFKQHLFEMKGENYHLSISPIVDFSLGKDISDTSDRRLFQNTRGIFIEGDLMKNFSFSTSIYENQARFTRYESAFYQSIGELYPNQTSGVYTTQNAVIPGSARTKPFKEDGFDYAYAMGNMIYRPVRQVALSAGNTLQFIGDGYRSMLLSDNALPAPFFRVDYKISKRWEFNYLRMRSMNFMRKAVYNTVEAYYETKGTSVNYLTFHATDKIALSLFESMVWYRGDSISASPINPLYFNPIPVLNGLVVKDSKAQQQLGLNLSIVANDQHRFYGQFVMANYSVNSMAAQVGYRAYLGKKSFSMVQVEYNYASKNMYLASNIRLNYTHGNVSMAHPKGNGFQEIVLRYAYDKNRWYADLRTNIYLLNGYHSTALLSVHKTQLAIDGTLLLHHVECGYRVNRKMNLCFFVSGDFRYGSAADPGMTSALNVGLRTAINNHYSDF
jgi:hypothetical protein